MTASFPYKTVLITGASAGIGAALAERFFPICEAVILTGRRESNLQAICAGHLNAHYRVNDATDLASIPAFAEDILSSFPKLDCIILNAGIQRGLNFTKPESIDLGKVDSELKTNYVSVVHMLKYFLPHLMKQPSAAVAGVSSTLAMVPIPRCPNYCATKAALHHLLMMLRFQLKGTTVKVIEIFPPGVKTELHLAINQPDLVNGDQIGIPLDEFMDVAWTGLMEGEQEIPVGQAIDNYETVERARHKQLAKVFGGDVPLGYN
ncbi:short-chain dehydrogenase/oxidoreductase [Calocera viscosa TUFC12733]|uniref:Short-chain dehydrogenase/oxidoreductase n=1 Tax=Calocera viscosa (strain TUFC12733) TaxID=1330018 RepID=A0A167K008_CALVF|nr:short-chain dehydrogenase/oxidoreductase [Calocera viscosa TUFC12733]